MRGWRDVTPVPQKYLFTYHWNVISMHFHNCRRTIHFSNFPENQFYTFTHYHSLLHSFYYKWLVKKGRENSKISRANSWPSLFCKKFNKGCQGNVHACKMCPMEEFLLVSELGRVARLSGRKNYVLLNQYNMIRVIRNKI